MKAAEPLREANVGVRPLEYPASGRVRTGSLYQAARETPDAPPGVVPAAVPAVVVVHGLFVSRALPEIDRFCRRLAADYDVVAIDMRGHGDGPGRFTWGREEHRDLADLIVFLRGLCPSVGVVGFSFGGDVAIFSAALAGQRDDGARPDALCTIGSPAHLDLWRYRFRLAGLRGHLRMMLRRKRRRFAPGWPDLRWRRAVDLVAGVAPVPLLILHGERDWLVHPEQARQLYEAAGQPKEILFIKGGLHAEFIVAQDPAMLLQPVRRFFGEHLARSGRVDPGGRPSGDVSLTRGRS